MKPNYWLNKVTNEYFDDAVKEIIDERQPASIGRYFLEDMLEERRPDLFEEYPRKVVRQCIYVSMKKLKYTANRSKSAFWREPYV